MGILESEIESENDRKKKDYITLELAKLYSDLNNNDHARTLLYQIALSPSSNTHHKLFAYDNLVSIYRSSKDPAELYTALRHIGESKDIILNESLSFDVTTKSSFLKNVIIDKFQVAEAYSGIGDKHSSIEIKQELLEEIDYLINELGFNINLCDSYPVEYIKLSIADDYFDKKDFTNAFLIYDFLIQNSANKQFSKANAVHTKYMQSKKMLKDEGFDSKQAYEKSIYILKNYIQDFDYMSVLEKDDAVLMTIISYLNEKWHYTFDFDSHDEELLWDMYNNRFEHDSMTSLTKGILLKLLVDFNQKEGREELSNDFRQILINNPNYQY